MYLNSRGWVEFRLQNHKNALKDLKEAVNLYAAGAN